MVHTEKIAIGITHSGSSSREDTVQMSPSDVNALVLLMVKCLIEDATRISTIFKHIVIICGDRLLVNICVPVAPLSGWWTYIGPV